MRTSFFLLGVLLLGASLFVVSRTPDSVETRWNVQLKVEANKEAQARAAPKRTLDYMLESRGVDVGALLDKRDSPVIAQREISELDKLSRSKNRQTRELALKLKELVRRLELEQERSDRSVAQQFATIATQRDLLYQENKKVIQGAVAELEAKYTQALQKAITDITAERDQHKFWAAVGAVVGALMIGISAAGTWTNVYVTLRKKKDDQTNVVQFPDRGAATDPAAAPAPDTGDVPPPTKVA